MRLKPIILDNLALLVGLILAAWLRFQGLRMQPAWYWFEGAFINVAANLAQGRWQYLPFQSSMRAVY